MNGDNPILLIKIQPTPDTDPIPVGANSVVFEGLDWKPYEGDTITRNRGRSYHGAQEQIRTGPYTDYSFSCELAQASAAGTAPGFGPALRACGMAEVIDPGVSVTYTPVSSGYEQVAAYQIDDQEQIQKSINCKGSFGIEINAGELPKINFSSFMGTYNRPITLVAPITVDNSSFEDAVPVSFGATQTVTIDSYDFCLDAFSYDHGGTVIYKDRPNCIGTKITGRDGGGTLVVRAPSLSDKDVYAFLESHVNVTKVPIQVIHGDGSRPDLTVNIPLAQFTGLSKTEIDGELFYSMPYKAIPSDPSGNDEIELIF